MNKERLYIYDTTLRDGQQTHGIQFSTDDKINISKLIDMLGVDFIEGGWPGANPTDSEFFASVPKLNATMTAFGMTKRDGRSAENEEVLAAVINAGTTSVCLVGKTYDFHVTKALGIGLTNNIVNISKSIEHIVAKGREAIFDAEHFFDGYYANPNYALDCLHAAYSSGSRWIVLCDTNGGTLPSKIYQITQEVIKSGISGSSLGIHCHNDTENAIAGSLAAIDAGVRQVQGTINGLGERCGNTNLISLIPTLLLKEPYKSKFSLGIGEENLLELTKTSRLLDDILNRVSNTHSAYVGSSAFAHKAGLHASAILKDPSTYEHIDPGLVGNDRIIPMSNQAGQSNLKKRLSDAGIEGFEKASLSRLLDTVKENEDRGYSYDTAQASFELLALKELDKLPIFFKVVRYRVTVERRQNKIGDFVTLSEAVVVVNIGDEKKLSVSESMDEVGSDRGPVNALSRALAKDLGSYQSAIDDMRLVDFKVRITSGGTEAVTRVIIDCVDQSGARWSTVGVSPNIVDASFEALLDAINWKLIKENCKV